MPNADLESITMDSEQSRNYWLSKLKGNLQKCCFCYDRRDLGAQQRLMAEVKFAFDGDLSAKLIHLSNNSDIRLQMILIAGVVALLRRYTGEPDIIAGTTIHKQEVEGDFINTILPLRNQVDISLSFKELLLQVKQTLLEAIENQNFPMETLLNQLDLPATGFDFPLFDVVILLENIQARSYIDSINPNVVFIFKREGQNIEGRLEYNSTYYFPDSIELIITHLITLFTKTLEDINSPLETVEIISDHERECLLVDFNHTRWDYPEQKTIHRLFEEQVSQTPENTAVVFNGKSLTYRELNDRANRLAHWIRKQGVKPEKIVAIMVERSLDMAVGVIGILKSGAAYLPIDPRLPADRIEYILIDSEATLLVTQRRINQQGHWNGISCYLLDDPSFDEADLSNPENINKAGDLAYMIYTSGTTGHPKGVMIEQRSISNTLRWRKDEYQLDHNDKVLQLFSYAFDGFLTSFFTPLISGAQVLLLDDDMAKNPIAIKNCIAAEGVTHFIAVPALFSAICDFVTKDEFRSLRIVTLAGEKVTEGLLQKYHHLNPQFELVNEYGPTENSVASTIFRNMQACSRITIGKPIRNTCVYILDQNGQLQPMGVVGEICLSSEGLARGYHKNQELTAEKFFPNPFVGRSDIVEAFHESTPVEGLSLQRMYRTGDLGRWLPDGNIDYISRNDHQVKIRGFRIELGEVESYLHKLKSVKEVIVIDKEDANGGRYLCAYLILEEDSSIAEVREYAAQGLPDYMMPSFFVAIDKIPLTLNGKIDKKALPQPQLGVNQATAYVAPRNPTEEKMVDLWRELLGVDKIGINDSFFELGGDSLKATSLVARIYKDIGMEISLIDIFNQPSIKEIVAKLQPPSDSSAEELQEIEKLLTELEEQLEGEAAPSNE
ncbi:MAG TPA: non-ribosomal peptide synthetase [Bacillota bacterium]|nr:non-ribosomal peptide synthetase [Bacillota bacterium]